MEILRAEGVRAMWMEEGGRDWGQRGLLIEKKNTIPQLGPYNR